MAVPSTFRFVARVALSATLAAGAIGAIPSSPEASASALSRWTGGIDLYRSGTFTTQQTWLWCTAADVQIIRNIVDRATDHSASSQQRYFDYMRAHNRYDIPLSDGVDAAGWTAGLRRYVDDRYRMVASTSFDAGLRSAVTSLRRTNLPVGIIVLHGDHAWVLTGFTASADPATTSRFTITSVRVVGPLWGLQSRSYGYDMRPDTKLTPAQLQTFFTPWRYASVHMAWEGRWVSVQPIARSAALPKAAVTTAPTASAPASAAPSAASVSDPPPDPTSADIAVSQPATGADQDPDPASTAPIAEAAPAAPTAPTADRTLIVELLAGLAILVVAALAVTRGIIVRRRRGP